MTLDVETAKKLLSDVEEKKYFKLKRGHILKNLTDLYEELSSMKKKDFDHHVNKKKNDFAEWVEHSIEDQKLADSLRETTDFEKAKDKVKSRLFVLKLLTVLKHEIKEDDIKKVEDVDKLVESDVDEKKPKKEIVVEDKINDKKTTKKESKDDKPKVDTKNKEESKKENKVSTEVDKKISEVKDKVKEEKEQRFEAKDILKEKPKPKNYDNHNMSDLLSISNTKDLQEIKDYVKDIEKNEEKLVEELANLESENKGLQKLFSKNFVHGFLLGLAIGLLVLAIVLKMGVCAV